MNEQEKPAEIDNNYGVVLPCSEAEFGDFVSSLLGKPQTISRFVSGVFEISRDDLINIHHLIDQRIHQQNEGVLIQFVSVIMYGDGSSVQLNDINDFISYNEVSPRHTVAIQLSWIYLVQFRDRKHPEKQEIELAFYTSKRHRNIRELQPYPFDEVRGPGRFELTIRHTARSWGVDFESLLTKHIQGLRIRTDDFESWIARHCGLIGFWSALLFFVGSTIGAYFVADAFGSKQKATSLKSIREIGDTDEKIQFLLESMLAGYWPKFILGLIIFFIVAFIISTAVGIIVSVYADNHRMSFLLITKEDNALHKSLSQSQQYGLAKFVLALGLSVCVGVAANMIFSWIFTS